ncbi:hypothetical protein Tco_1492445 [Tanacetum coccineum]
MTTPQVHLLGRTTVSNSEYNSLALQPGLSHVDRRNHAHSVPAYVQKQPSSSRGSEVGDSYATYVASYFVFIGAEYCSLGIFSSGDGDGGLRWCGWRSVAADQICDAGMGVESYDLGGGIIRDDWEICDAGMS